MDPRNVYNIQLPTHPCVTHTHTHAVAALEKSPTAQDFTDIAEVAEDDEGEGTSAATPSVESSSGGDVERLYQKGISFAQSQLAGEECACTHLLCVGQPHSQVTSQLFITDMGMSLATIGQPYLRPISNRIS